LILALTAAACRTSFSTDTPGATQPPAGQTAVPNTQAAPPTIPPGVTRVPAEAGGDEPVFISGEIPYTSPFFMASTAEPYVMLEDQAGFVARDEEFQFSLPSQVIGPVEILEDQSKLTFSLALPSIPQATYLDVDNNGQKDTGLQIFAVAYWSNTWDDPFLQRRDGTGWSTAYASTVTDPERENEIIGGRLVIWSPDDAQSFPTDFGADNMLFTKDDPVAPVPAGYNLVNLDERPFRVYKESQPVLTLNEGVSAVNDFSGQNYAEAFQSLFDKASKEYPFTQLKNLNWQAIYDRHAKDFEAARNDEDFYRALRGFTLEIPDGHVGMGLNQQVFFETYGGGLGMTLAELSDGKVIVVEALDGQPAKQAGIQPGAEIITWNGKPIAEAIAAVTPGFAPYSTAHATRRAQVNFLSRMAPNTTVDIRYRNPDGSEQDASLQAAAEYDSLFRILPSFTQDALALPVDATVLKDSGVGYVRITTFQDDYNLMARVWERTMQNLIDNEVPALVIDVRVNGGGSLGIALDFAGYFFDEELPLYQNYYYNENTGEFKETERPTRVRPAPLHYAGKVAVLVGPDCVSACEGFAYAMQQQGRAIVVGHTPSAGAFGEVGQGQYKLPADISLQFPTGRSQAIDGEDVVLEGKGVVPDVVVPVTLESALGQVDAVLQAAIQALLK
jgi:C-terminal processing protease CtpA/Prc